VQGKRYRLVPSILIQVIITDRIQSVTYSFRLISISCRPFFTFSIDGHNLTVIELDGVEHDPVTVQNVDVYAGTSKHFVKEEMSDLMDEWFYFFDLI
jgi:hypothetical protein